MEDNHPIRVLLIDIGSKIPNLALMKISAYHKSRGDIVGFNVSNPDKVYASVIFKANRHQIDGLRYWYPDAEIDIGGSGYDLSKKLPRDIEECSPDYDLYPENDTYYGFTSRGCIRDCHFCIVRKKEGAFRILYDDPKKAIDVIKGDHDFKKIIFFDNNILASKKWFMALTEELLEQKLKVDFNQGLDIRLIDKEIASRLAQLHPINCWKFAYDSTDYTKAVIDGITILKEAGINTKQKCLFYVYCDGQYQIKDAVNRCRTLKEHNCTAYSMINRDVPQTKELKQLRRWTRPWIFWSVDFEDFKKKIGGTQ